MSPAIETRIRRAHHSWISFGAVTLVVSIAVASLGVVPWAFASLAERPAPSATETTLPEITETWPDGDFRLPIVISGGRLDTAFPDGIPVRAGGSLYGTEDTPEVIAQVSAIAADAGLGAYVPVLLSRGQHPYPPEYEQVTAPYPYRYPVFDQLMAQVLTPDFIETHHGDLVELTSALLYADRAAPAFSILNRMREIANDCTVQLNLALTVALGFDPEMANVATEFEEAITQCPDEPAALSAYVQVVLAQETRGETGPATQLPGEIGQEQHALELVARLQQLFPQHAAGYLAEAAVLLEIADKYRRAGVHPFTARQMYERALILTKTLTAVQPDQTVILGQARAEAGLGHPQEALNLALPQLNKLQVVLEKTRAVDLAYQAALDLGEAGTARDLVDQTPVSYHNSQCRSLLPTGFNGPVIQFGAPVPGFRGVCLRVLQDATGGRLAGGMSTFSFHGYIPKYRNTNIWSEVLDYASGEAPAPHIEALMAGEFGLPDTVAEQVESLQDGLRRLGRYEDAERLLQATLHANPSLAGLLSDRLGEVLYLKGDYQAAADAFAAATKGGLGSKNLLVRTADEQHLGPAWSSIKQATALLQSGDEAQAIDILSSLEVLDGTGGAATYRVDPQFNRLLAQYSLLGQSLLAIEDYPGAVTALQVAHGLCTQWQGRGLHPCVHGVQANNLGVALIKSGRPDEAAEPAREAWAADPANAMFAELLANALEASGDTNGAIEAYRAVAAADPSQFTAHNNLGVLLAERGDLDAAVASFRNAIAVRPGYALGWFNLGTALGADGRLTSFVDAQGALGKAAQLDPAFRDASPAYITDMNAYDSGLDLSKPLPPDWSAAVERQPLAPTFGLGIAIVAMLQAARALLGDHITSSITERLLGLGNWLPSSTVGRLPGLGLIAVAVCAAVTSWSLVAAMQPTAPGRIMALAVSLLLAVAYVSSRLAVAPASRHTLSAGGTLVGLACAPLGIGFAPVPVLKTPASRTARLAPQLMLTTVSLIAICTTAFTGVPLARATAQAALMLLSSSLVPVPPFDGDQMPARWGLPVAIGLSAPTALFAMHLI